MKKTLSLILVLVMLTAMLLPCTVGIAAGKCTCDDVPIIYVRGRATLLKDKSLPQSETNPDLPYVKDGRILEEVKRLVPIFAECALTGDYTEWIDEFVAVFADIYEDWALNEKGEVDNNSGITWSWSENSITTNHKDNVDLSVYWSANSYIYRYFYQYDCRLDPLEIADGLHDYIEAVKRRTGHDTVKIISRCLGTSISAAYFTKYGYDDIESLVIYNPIMNGTVVTDTLFTGELYIDDAQLDFFATQELGDDPIMNLLKAMLTMFNEIKVLGFTTEQINNLINELAPQVIPKTLMVSYGTSPGYWAMVSPDKYEQARDFVFADEELREKYAELIAINDNYYNTVSKNIYTLHKEMEQAGVNVSVITKYGSQPYPVSDTALQSDQIITVEQQGMGTYAANIGEKLTEGYIAQANAMGTGQYISPDKIIDASTGLFPDTTWYIKNLVHNDFPNCVDNLMYTILNKYDGKMNVWTDENYPQFLVYNDTGDEATSTIEPMTEDNTGTDLEKPESPNVFIEFIMKIIAFLTALLNGEIDFGNIF